MRSWQPSKAATFLSGDTLPLWLAALGFELLLRLLLLLFHAPLLPPFYVRPSC